MSKRNSISNVFRKRTTDFLFVEGVRPDERMRVHFVDYCRNGSGNGAGYWRVLFTVLEGDAKGSRMMACLFDKNTPSETEKFYNTHGTMITVTNLDNPQMMWRPEYFLEGVRAVVARYRVDHKWPLNPAQS